MTKDAQYIKRLTKQIMKKKLKSKLFFSKKTILIIKKTKKIKREIRKSFII